MTTETAAGEMKTSNDRVNGKKMQKKKEEKNTRHTHKPRQNK